MLNRNHQKEKEMNDPAQSLNQASKRGMIWGVVTILCGILAIGSPLVSGLAVAIMVGVLLLMAGASMTFFAFQAPSLGKGFLKLLFGLLTVLVGISVLSQPGIALAQLTLLLGFYFIADGVVAMIVAFNIKPDPGWGWMTFNGAVTIALGWMILKGWPVSGVWAVGILVGVRLLFAGMTMLTMGTAGRQVAKTMQQP
jgi:uncharacterized membrane protein HdeD (DUF308 family)